MLCNVIQGADEDLMPSMEELQSEANPQPPPSAPAAGGSGRTGAKRIRLSDIDVTKEDVEALVARVPVEALQVLAAALSFFLLAPVANAQASIISPCWLCHNARLLCKFHLLCGDSKAGMRESQKLQTSAEHLAGGSV